MADSSYITFEMGRKNSIHQKKKVSQDKPFQYITYEQMCGTAAIRIFNGIWLLYLFHGKNSFVEQMEWTKRHNNITVYKWVYVPSTNVSISSPIPICTELYYTERHAKEAGTNALKGYNETGKQIKIERNVNNRNVDIHTLKDLTGKIIQITWCRIVECIAEYFHRDCSGDLPTDHYCYKFTHNRYRSFKENSSAVKYYWNIATSIGKQSLLSSIIYQCWNILKLPLADVSNIFQKVYNNLQHNDQLSYRLFVKVDKNSPEYCLVLEAENDLCLPEIISEFLYNEHIKPYTPSYDKE